MLSLEVNLDPVERAEALRRLLAVAAALGGQEGDALDGLLDALLASLGADRGCLLLCHQDGSTSVVGGRSPDGALTVREREEISKTVIRQALRERRAVLHHAVEGGLESIAELEILCAVAAPVPGLTPDAPSRGALYVDVRRRDKYLGEAHADFLEEAAKVFALAMERAPATTRVSGASSMGATDALDLRALLDLPGLASVAKELEAWLASDLPLLIMGESGVGKTLVAASVAHELGRQPVVRATLGSSDDLNTLTSELFGHERGAFSGAHAKRVGLVEQADGGVLILDEILCLPPHAQQLLLDFCQFGSYRPLGYVGSRPKHADVRLIAVTNGDLAAAVSEGRFRADLYYRIAGAELVIPPLRDRREDIPALSQRALEGAGGTRPLHVGLDLRRLLVDQRLTWKGNVRQLEFVLRRAAARARRADPDVTTLGADHVTAADFGGEVEAPSIATSAMTLVERWEALHRDRVALDAEEASIISDAIEAASGVVAHAARTLGAKRTSLLSRMNRLGIDGRRGEQG